MTSGLSHTFIRLTRNYSGKNLFPIRDGTRSIVLVPLVSADTKWGILEIHFLTEDALDRESFFNFYLLGQGIIRILENNRNLQKMVSIDRLTQVNNRNYYESQLPLEIERANRDRKNLAFLIMDIDDFKRVNDRYGHDVGDGVLRVVAHTIRSHLRKIDLLIRYGGEEFIALLPGAGREDAERTAERLREVVEHTVHTLEDGSEVHATISIGGCVYPDDAQNEIELFRVADKALYLSKRDGKNKVTFYESYDMN
jgi:diguanylate cyclase (GGDEF)-like protein